MVADRLEVGSADPSEAATEPFRYRQARIETPMVVADAVYEEPIEPETLPEADEPRDLRALAAGLGCIAAASLAFAVMGVSAAVATWYGWVGR